MQAQVARLREEVANQFKAQMQVGSLQILLLSIMIPGPRHAFNH
jgi:hypothetical protein